MANMAAKVTAAFFDANELNYEIFGDDDEVIRTGFSMDNREGLRIIIHFGDESDSVKISAYDLAKFPEAKKEIMYKICNDLNATYRWVKFYVDEDDNTITVEDDAVIQLDSCGDEILRCCLQLVHIADEAYPIIMRAIFG